MNIKTIFSGISADKKRGLIIVLGFAGILLIFISNFVSLKSSSDDEQPPVQNSNLTVDDYRNQLEEELSQIVSAINGAGNVKILITMDSTIEDVYVLEKNLSEKTVNNGGQEEFDSESEYKEDNEYVIIKSKDGSEQAVLQKQVMPKIRGVLVVCDGGDDAPTREKITKAVSSVLNISSGKVFVTA